MELRVKLMGALKAKTPAGERLSVDDAATVEQVLQALGIAATQVQIVMVNGRPQGNRALPLSPDDELTVVPPVGGG